MPFMACPMKMESIKIQCLGFDYFSFWQNPWCFFKHHGDTGVFENNVSLVCYPCYVTWLALN